MKKSDLLKLMKQTASVELYPVDVPVWGRVYIKPLTVGEVEAQISEQKDDKNSIARNIARAICDEDGNRLLDPTNDEDIELLASQPWTQLDEIRLAIEKSKSSKN